MRQVLIKDKCLHFGSCGGCTAQHLSAPAYSAWKEGQVAQILQKYDLKGCIEPIIKCPLYSRRRIELIAHKNKHGLKVGFNIYKTHEIIDIMECHIVLPQILHNIDVVKNMAALIDNQQEVFRINLLWTEEGLDVTFKEVGNLSQKRKDLLIQYAIENNIARLNLGAESLVEQRKPYIKFGDVAVYIAPASFIQAVEAIEKKMVELAIEHLKKCKSVIDLFAGSGSFTFPLLKYMSVHAVEFEKSSLRAMIDAYSKQNYKLKPLTTEQRNLFNMPLTAKELNNFDAIIFDPPRAGANAQCREIVKSNVTKIVAVSCNADSLAQDLKILQDGGYNIDKIIPVDQFLWSPHCEIVAFLSKKKKKQGWKL